MMRKPISQKRILDIKNTFYNMHPISDAKRGIMQTGVIESIWAEGSTALTCSIRERTALEER
jgi:hypothetical protein